MTNFGSDPVRSGDQARSGEYTDRSFIDLLTSTDSDVLRAVASFIYTANIT